ncbi:MAG: hypothetical protein HY059_22290 [Proteobacteria bacterium]|nr:hypothetical protein [Pseudomonadota bacterium]
MRGAILAVAAAAAVAVSATPEPGSSRPEFAQFPSLYEQLLKKGKPLAHAMGIDIGLTRESPDGGSFDYAVVTQEGVRIGSEERRSSGARVEVLSWTFEFDVAGARTYRSRKLLIKEDRVVLSNEPVPYSEEEARAALERLARYWLSELSAL